MIKEFVTYEIAKELKELGFNEECFGIYGRYSEEFALVQNAILLCKADPEVILAPLWQQVIEWFWDNYKIFVSHYLVPDRTNTILWVTKFEIEDYWSTKEQAILKAIELCKNKN